MRIRTIKPEFFLHDELFDLEKSSELPIRLAFIGLWCAADRKGRFKWEPRRLGAAILPYDGADFSRVLDALATRGFIERHASGTVEFGVIPSFERHQLINNRESQSVLPEPTEESVIIGLPTREPRDDDACGTREVHAQAEGKGREGKGKEVARRAAFSPSMFDHMIPEGLSTFADFVDSWHGWMSSRHDRKKPISEAAAKTQLEDLAGFGHVGAVLSIRQSIAHDWRGLFAPKTQGVQSQPVRAPATPATQPTLKPAWVE